MTRNALSNPGVVFVVAVILAVLLLAWVNAFFGRKR